MSKQEEMKSYLPSYYDDVLEMQAVIDAEYPELENIDIGKTTIENNIFIDTAGDYGLSRLESIFKAEVVSDSSIDERRSVLKSMLRGQNKLNATNINNISLAYQNGGVEVSFVPSNIIVKFISAIGVPSNIDSLKKYLNERIPSHLGIIYVLKYLNVNEIEAMTLLEIEALTLDKFAF